ncbi:MAG: DUF3375 domain-containing protein [Selenomonas sp.]|uniref:DUF3375 domain-containing protein n=1 Tax=Selenomonas sp. TaxID=2053611 RepID=UPI0025FE6B18|nr:DUF3375 domain-containing protein [Selenomonas sp.]MCR5756472.1 DUF3375 domain-containing protein [Selenomonas sp.]
MPNENKYMTYEHLLELRQNHAAWRLLRADYCPMVAAFFFQAFIGPKRRGIEAQELLENLDTFLYDCSGQNGEFARSPKDYLEMWADSSYGWLRKYEYRGDWYYDLTAPAQKAVEWLLSLHKQDFIGTESRLRTVFNLLHEIAQETDTDAEHRLAYLTSQQEKIAAEIKVIEETGEVRPRLDDIQIKERFLQAESTATAILADFREVEENFRELTRKVQADIVKWTKGKGELLEKIFSESDIIRKSEQGRSFMAFWRFLMLSQQQDDLRETLQQVESREAIRPMVQEHSLADINREWVQAAAAVQKTLGQLSAQLRRYVDEDYLREERNIYRLIQNIESKAVDRKGQGLSGMIMTMNTLPKVHMPMERRLFAPPKRIRLESPELTAGDGGTGSLAAIFDQVVVDKEKLKAHVADLLQERNEVTLAEVLAVYPLELGLAELLGYLVLASRDAAEFTEERLEKIVFERDGRKLQAVCQQVIFRKGAGHS